MTNKLSEFPLERAGLDAAPDNTVIVAWPGWSLTVGDVREARAGKILLNAKQKQELTEIGRSWMSETGREVLDDWLDVQKGE